MSKLTPETRDLLLEMHANLALLREELAQRVRVLEELAVRPDMPAGTPAVVQGDLAAARELCRSVRGLSPWLRSLVLRASREALAEVSEPGCESTGG